MHQDLLFNRQPLSDLLFAWPKMLAKDIEGLDRNAVLNASLSDLADHLVSKFTLDVPRLLLDKAHIRDPEDAQIDVSHDFTRYFHGPGPHYVQGTAFTLVIPFEGDSDCFGLQPSRFSMSGVHGAVRGNALVLRHERLDHDAAPIKSDFDRRLAQIQEYLATQKQDCNDWHTKLPDTVRTQLEARKKRILDGLNLTQSLGFPLHRRVDSTYAVPVARKRVVVEMPTPKTGTYAAEPELRLEAYEDILQTISSLSLMMERSPSAFTSMGEEDLRNHILVILNTQFEGRVTGETFNREGKTDILIREKDRNVFIAECKFWDGPKSLTGAIDQVLRYASWRDTKVAVIVFNRRKDISAVLAAVPGAVSQHSLFKKQLPYKADGGFRFLFGQKDDRNRDVLLTVLIFDVPSAAQDEPGPPPTPDQPAAPPAAPQAAKRRRKG